jgi:hypothetical protein
VDTSVSTAVSPIEKLEIEIPGVASMQLQTLDIARHVVPSPNNKRYVVATYDATRIGHPYMTAVYPQQGGYLTLLRLMICEFPAEQAEDAAQRHRVLVQAILEGNLQTYIKENQRNSSEERFSAPEEGPALARP